MSDPYVREVGRLGPAGCDAVTAAEGSGVWECTETGPHTRHVARSVIDGTVLHTWQDAPTQDQARAAALERLARDMLASYHQGSDGYRGRVGQMQIQRWQAVVDGEVADGG
jgi:hypothetical protein